LFYCTNSVEKLDNLHENNPKEYWQLLNYVTKDRDNSPESQILRASSFKDHVQSIKGRQFLKT
jgi:hypothetical protein